MSPDKPTKMQDDSAVRVVVTPSQSSYFAGEPFSVTITLTNTRSPEAGPSSRPAGAGHRRGVHSISSAPIAPPPTSPGTPRMVPPPVPVVRRKGEVRRLGLVGVKEKEKEKEKEKGKDTDGVGELMEQRRRKMLAKSLSVAVSPREIEDLQGESKSASYAQSSFTVPPLPTAAPSPSPLARTSSFPTDHPHARKHSLFDGQFSISPTPPAPPAPPPPPQQNGSTSTFTLPLDPISESTTHPYAQSNASLVGPSIEVPTKPFTPPVSPAASESNGNGNGHASYPPKRRPAHLQNLSHPSSPPPTPSLHPNAETILYAYAQLVGSLNISPVLGTLPSPAQEANLRLVRRQLVKKKAVGGGSMDISASLGMRRRPTHARSASLSSSLMSLISPRGSWRSMSTALASPSSSPLTPAFPGSFPVEEDADPDAPLPTFEVQPEMLGVDVCLMPGESRSYTYTIALPANLPPTFRGKAMKLSYELVVGTCRAASGSAVSRVMKVPIRVYNHVSVISPPQAYDILWPVRPKGHAGGENRDRKVGEEDVVGYARRLVSTLPSPGAPDQEGKVRIKVPAEAIGGWERGAEDHEEEEEREEGGCREAVEVLTRNMKKASYDVTKDGVKVAVLTFSKSAYRLGETIMGVVEVNERRGMARVVKLSATLEAHELLPQTISPPSASRHLRRAHAECYNSFTLNTLRTTFSLDIPSDATPAFGVVIPDLASPSNNEKGKEKGGLEWKVRLCLLVAIASPSSTQGTEGVVFKSLVRDGPRGEWGSPFTAPRTLAPLHKPAIEEPKQTWSSFFSNSLFAGEREYHDGDDLDGEEEGLGYDGIVPHPEGGVGVGVDYGAGEGWREVRMETVECEVPVGVWPGNTVYRSQEVVFDV